MADEAQESQEQAAQAEAAEGSLLDEILSQTKMAPSEEGYDLAKRGVEAFISEMLAPTQQYDKADKKAVDLMISEIDRKISKQLDAVLHHEEFQKLEGSWRSLKMLVDRTNFRENIKIQILNVSKDQLLEDFEDSPELTKSGLYKQVYTAEYGQFGGEPFGAMIANYEFSYGPQDMQLLGNCASLGAMAHCPFLTGTDPKMFGIEDWRDLPNLKDLKGIFEGPQYAKWNSFRESDDARAVGMCGPRMLLRLPYGQETVPVKSFNYEEQVQGDHKSYLWGNTAFALGTRIADSFAKWRWCPNIIGPQSGGAVEDLPLHQYESMGEIETKIPTETLISERREYEMSEEGFIALAMRKGSDNAAFFSANSCQKPKTFGISKEGKEAEMNYRLATQLPYMMIMNRLAHYIKVLQREQIGSWKEKEDLQRELNKWLSQYVADMESPSPAVRSRCPLKKAQITVEDVDGEPGWYKVDMKVRPHFKYMGAFFTLGLVGKLDKS